MESSRQSNCHSFSLISLPLLFLDLWKRTKKKKIIIKFLSWILLVVLCITRCSYSQWIWYWQKGPSIIGHKVYICFKKMVSHKLIQVMLFSFSHSLPPFSLTNVKTVDDSNVLCTEKEWWTQLNKLLQVWVLEAKKKNDKKLF